MNPPLPGGQTRPAAVAVSAAAAVAAIAGAVLLAALDGAGGGGGRDLPAPPDSATGTSAAYATQLRAGLDRWVATVEDPHRGVTATFEVLVADTADARQAGLSHLDHLGDSSGMLFLFDTAAAHGGFWMNDTRLELTVVFLADAADTPGSWPQVPDTGRILTVVAALPMTPCAPDPCPIYRSPGPYIAALEVPSGALPPLTGDTVVRLRRPGPRSAQALATPAAPTVWSSGQLRTLRR
jgi:uncharacterized membrane protein (UPF0127 family)